MQQAFGCTFALVLRLHCVLSDSALMDTLRLCIDGTVQHCIDGRDPALQLWIRFSTALMDTVQHCMVSTTLRSMALITLHGT